MLLGRKAAEIAVNALTSENVSKNALSKFNDWLTSGLFKGVEFEADLIQTMSRFSDEELNTICECFKDINLEPFFTGT